MITCILKTILLVILFFVLLSYVIYLYERSNRDQTQIKSLLGIANIYLTIKIIVVEYLSLIVTVILWPFGYLNITEGETSNKSQTPILLLHGLFLNRSCWTIMKLRLRLQGFSDVHTINMPPTRDIETLTEKVALKIDTLRHTRNCEKVHLVGHSMGGIIARNYVQIRGGADKVDQCLLIGSPHNGSKLAPFAVTKLSEAVMPACEFLTNLNKKTIPKKVTITNIYSKHDNLVIPYDSAILDKATNIELTGKGHNTLLYDNAVFNRVLTAIKATNNADDSDQQPQEG